MGLDMYLTGEKFVMGLKLEEDGFRLGSKTLELGYWRKHPNLHGYIVQTFAGGKDECQNIYLGVAHIRTIIAAVTGRSAPGSRTSERKTPQEMCCGNAEEGTLSNPSFYGRKSEGFRSHYRLQFLVQSAFARRATY